MTSKLTCKEFVAMRSSLRNREGERYVEFLKCVRHPNYVRMWRDIAAGHAMIGLVIVALHLGPNGVWYTAGFGLAGAVAIGAALHYLLLFFHEASHHLIAKTKLLNDRRADFFLGSLFLYPIAEYRAVHMAHHRALGTPDDPERSYFNPLNVSFLMESLFGIQALRTFLIHRTGPNGKPSRRFSTVLFVGVTLHGGVLISAVWAEAWPLLVAWIAGVGMVFPALSALRQLLEHRDFAATGDVAHYRVEPHGEILRCFKSGLLSRIIGAAGFDRHALHHLEPQVSYQYLPLLEAFLLQTDLADWIAANQTNYGTAWRSLFAER